MGLSVKRDKWGIISPLRHHLTGELDSKGEYDPVKSGEIKREGGGESMFLHGIPFVHLVSQYPELSLEEGRGVNPRHKKPMPAVWSGIWGMNRCICSAHPGNIP